MRRKGRAHSPSKGQENYRYPGKLVGRDWTVAPEVVHRGLTTLPISSTVVGPDLALVCRNSDTCFCLTVYSTVLACATSGCMLDNEPSRGTPWWFHANYWNWLSSKSPAEPGRSLLLVDSCFAASPWMVRSIRSKIGCDFLSSRTCLISCRNW